MKLMTLLEKAMAPHSSALAWKIPWTEEPGRLQSMGSLGVGHDCATSLSLSTFMHWRRKWQPTPVFVPGESHGRRNLVGYSPWGRTELDTTEATWQQQQQPYIYICNTFWVYTHSLSFMRISPLAFSYSMCFSVYSQVLADVISPMVRISTDDSSKMLWVLYTNH